MARHASLNDAIWRALTRAGFPSTKEPTGLARNDGKRPDGVTLVPWQAGRCVTWDVTVVDTLAESYLSRSAQGAGAAAEIAADRKVAKYNNLIQTYLFVPLAFETLGPLNQEGHDFVTRLGRHLGQITSDPRETSFLYQRLAVTIQRFNAVAFRGTFEEPDSYED
jgi:hypothetical protein